MWVGGPTHEELGREGRGMVRGSHSLVASLSRWASLTNSTNLGHMARVVSMALSMWESSYDASHALVELSIMAVALALR